MIYVTGDIHADPRRFDTSNFPEQKEMTKNDFVIVCGDFGLCWEKEESDKEEYWLNWIEAKPFTMCFVDGNHENFARLNNLPVEDWHGGKVHKLRPHVIHLMRGEMFTMCDKHIFAFGGARSHDINGLASNEELRVNYTAGVLRKNDPEYKKKKELLSAYGLWSRTEGESWWKEEMPSDEEMQHGLDVLAQYDNSADFIISHDGPASDLALLGGGLLSIDPLNKYLEHIKQSIDYKWWFFGHHHEDRRITDKDAVLYHQITRIS